MDGPTAQGFLSLTAFQAEGCGGALRAQIVKKGRALRHFDESVAEWRNLPPLMVRTALRWEISGLRVSSKRFPPAPYRHASPLEMTMLASAPLVISTEAKRSGEISRLNEQESGCGFRRWLCRKAVKGKVDGPPARGFLRFLSLTRFRREGGGGGFAADDKVSVTRLAFYVIGTAAQIL